MIVGLWKSGKYWREIVAAAAVTVAAVANASTEAKEFVGSDGGIMRYRLAEKQAEDGGKIPLVIFMHGAGERGTNNISQLKHGVGDILNWLEEHEKGYRLVAAQVPSGKRWVEVDWGAKSHDMPETPSETMTLMLEYLDMQLADPVLDVSRNLRGETPRSGEIIAVIELICR